MRPERALGVRSEAMLALAFIRRDQVVFRLPLCAVSFDQSAITGECFIELAAQAIAFLLECLATLAPIRRHRISSMLSLLCCDRGVDIGGLDFGSRVGRHALIWLATLESFPAEDWAYDYAFNEWRWFALVGADRDCRADSCRSG